MKLRIGNRDYERVLRCAYCYNFSHAEILGKAIRWSMKNGYSVDNLEKEELVHQINAPNISGIESHDLRCMLRSYLDWHFNKHGEPTKRPEPIVEETEYYLLEVE